MPSSPPPATALRRSNLAALRKAVAALDGTGLGATGLDVAPKKARLTFGTEPADGRTGGLSPGIHDFYADTPDDGGAVRGFGLALASRLGGPVLLVEDRLSVLEHGSLHGPGLLAFGLDPARVLVVAVRDARDLLWAVEEGLGCPALSAVVAMLSGEARPYTLTASRRLALAAARTGVTALILRLGAPEEIPTAALTRWRIRGLASEEEGEWSGGVGPPAFEAHLVRRRQGGFGGPLQESSPESPQEALQGPSLSFRLAWSGHSHAFRTLPPLPRDQPAAPAGRSGAAVV